MYISFTVFIFSTICNGSTGKDTMLSFLKHTLSNDLYSHMIHDKATQHTFVKKTTQKTPNKQY